MYCFDHSTSNLQSELLFVVLTIQLHTYTDCEKSDPAPETGTTCHYPSNFLAHLYMSILGMNTKSTPHPLTNKPYVSKDDIRAVVHLVVAAAGAAMDGVAAIVALALVVLATKPGVMLTHSIRFRYKVNIPQSMLGLMCVCFCLNLIIVYIAWNAITTNSPS